VAAYVALDWTKTDYMACTHGYFKKKICQLSDDCVFIILKKEKKNCCQVSLIILKKILKNRKTKLKFFKKIVKIQIQNSMSCL
jgi:hypothetical protein